MSKAQQIAAVVAQRIDVIQRVNGYSTDIGGTILGGRRAIDDSQVPCTVLVEGDDIVKSREGKQVSLTQPIYLEAHDECDPDNPNDRAHLMVADIKRAIFSGDERLGGLAKEIRYVGRTIEPREQGSKLVAVQVRIEVDYVESLDAP